MILTVLQRIKLRKVRDHLNVRLSTRVFGLKGLSAYLSAALVVLTLVGYILFNALVASKAEVKTLKAANKLYVSQMEQSKAIQKSFESSHQNIVLQFQTLEEKYKKQANKEYVVLAKPKLVEKLANRKFKKQEKEMACLTGNKSKC